MACGFEAFYKLAGSADFIDRGLNITNLNSLTGVQGVCDRAAYRLADGFPDSKEPVNVLMLPCTRQPIALVVPSVSAANDNLIFTTAKITSTAEVDYKIVMEYQIYL
ncbi:unnamed protein product [Protopolystoma xenopodis]|uniref:Uncharacterized protein n=1 Tax=Protopolystoma xenopodis TaxID=117903 RepID=A0A3S5AWS2_9PLAT|nr:unnamed protein product [Protopolystoma xenopodis]